MQTRVGVPWRPDGGYRDRLWSFARERWQRAGFGQGIVEGRSPAGPFNRSAAINDAAHGDWDVFIVADADVLIDGAQVREAIERALSSGRVVLPFTHYVGLTPNMTKRVLDGYDGDWDRGARFRSQKHESSCVVVPRAAWETTGGFDERFIGWGQEDVAFIQSARLLVGEVERIDGHVWHLWHPRAPERDPKHVEYQANQALGQRYRDARSSRDIRALIGEKQMEQSERAARFARIYDVNEWQGRGGVRAGPGSSLAATEELARSLPKIIEDMSISSVLDAGCGDGQWMPDLPGYLGVDIVQRAVKTSQKRYPEREYQVLDICIDDLPYREAIICRDALQHLSLVDGLSALNNFRRSGAKYLLANTHRDGDNVDITSGEFYEDDLEAAPFWLGSPILEMFDGRWEGNAHRYPGKVFGVWEL